MSRRAQVRSGSARRSLTLWKDPCLREHEHSTWSLAVADLVTGGSDEAFGRVTRLATRLLSVPASFVAILDGTQQILKGESGVPASAVVEEGEIRLLPVDSPFLRAVVDAGHAILVEDVEADGGFASDSVLRALGAGSVMGLPIGLPDGTTVGCFCVIGAALRDWTSEDRGLLEDLRGVLSAEFALRQEVKQRKHLEQRTFLMSREMEHRIKNSLSSVQALILLSVREGQSPSEIRNDLLERVASLAKTQSLLADRGGKGALFADIVSAELQHFGIGTNVWIEGPEVLVGKDDAVSVAMVVHELATNATKHGALAPQVKGGVAVRWQKDLRDGQAALSHRARTSRSTRWEEWFGGGPLPEAVRQAGEFGFGTELLETLVLRQMRGAMSRELTPGGLLFTATVRLAEVPA